MPYTETYRVSKWGIFYETKVRWNYRVEVKILLHLRLSRNNVEPFKRNNNRFSISPRIAQKKLVAQISKWQKTASVNRFANLNAWTLNAPSPARAYVTWITRSPRQTITFANRSVQAAFTERAKHRMFALATKDTGWTRTVAFANQFATLTAPKDTRTVPAQTYARVTMATLLYPSI